MASRALKNRPGTQPNRAGGIILAVVATILGLLIAAVLGIASLCFAWLQDLPDYESAEAYNTALPTRVYAADGETLLAEFQLENRTPVAIDQISPYVLEGTVATEDVRFYEHNGVDLMGIARAVVNNVLGGELEGASTITQQFVRNTVLAGEMNDISLKRKLREAYISVMLEEVYSKDEILLMYLNTINYGSGAYGIEAASQRYFSKHASELTVAEAATLIGIPQSPTYNNPVDNPENALARRNVVLSRMLSDNCITQEEYDAALAEPIVLDETVPSQDGILKYPYFTSYVRNQLTDSEGKYAYSTAEIFKGGLTVVTTLDVDDQKAAEAAAEEKLEGLDEAFEVSLVAIDPDNGHIKAMVGGKDYDESQVNMATGEGSVGRQAGSSFKTFTLVASIDQGVNPNTLIDAGEEADFDGWEVANIYHADYGTTSIAHAFEVSSNTAFARLTLSLGADKVVDMAHKLGIRSELPVVPSVTLGTGSVTPLEMSSAYATIANGGIYYEPECIAQIIDRDGEVIIDNSEPEGERVISEEVARAAIDVMEGVVTSGTGTSAALSNGQPAAGKTGTTDSYLDSWFCGITPQYSVAIWLGDRSGYAEAEPVPRGVTAASTFAGFLDRVLAGEPIEYWFSADTPPYRDDYSDDKYHIGKYFDEEEEEEAEEEEAEENAEEGEGTPAEGEGEGQVPAPVVPDAGNGDAGSGETPAPESPGTGEGAGGDQPEAGGDPSGDESGDGVEQAPGTV